MSITDHHAPEGLRTRGTVIVVPGRGENAATYNRFGARLAADAYRVRVLDTPQLDGDDLTATLTALAASLVEAVSSDVEAPDPARPLVIVAVDSGAAALAALLGEDHVTQPWWPEALVLAGLPGYAASSATTWEAELDERTVCAVHRGVLSDEEARQRGALTAPVSDRLLEVAYGSSSDIPQLWLVGDLDPLADRDALTQAVKSRPRARLSVVRGSRHDVLNDVQHRSAAAEVVTFLEAVRNELVPVVSVESSAW